MKTKDILSLSFTGLLVVCALVITGLVVRREFFGPKQEPRIRQIRNWQDLDFNGSRTGPSEAPVQMVEFFDYQCPFCKSVQPDVRAVLEEHPNTVSVVHEHFPLRVHRHAFRAAEAAECARRKDRFAAFHKLLFANQERLGTLSYDGLAWKAGIRDTASFERCLETEKTANLVKSDQAIGKKLGVHAIPAFLINDKLITGALPKSRLEDLVQQALAEAK